MQWHFQWIDWIIFVEKERERKGKTEPWYAHLFVLKYHLYILALIGLAGSVQNKFISIVCCKYFIWLFLYYVYNMYWTYCRFEIKVHSLFIITWSWNSLSLKLSLSITELQPYSILQETSPFLNMPYAGNGSRFLGWKRPFFSICYISIVPDPRNHTDIKNDPNRTSPGRNSVGTSHFIWAI